MARVRRRAITVVGVLVQAFTKGAIWAWWGNWNAVGLAVAFLVICVAQLAFLGDTEEPGGWINGLHGFLAVFIALAGWLYFTRARQELGVGSSKAASS